MLINFNDDVVPVDAFLVYNFSQVSDAALVVAQTHRQKEIIKILLDYTDGQWMPNEDPNVLNAESFQQIGAVLRNISEIPSRLLSSYEESNSEEIAQQTLMLSGLCS